ncbi:MAG: alkaline phosphatase family protein [Halalkalicoccus sp.]
MLRETVERALRERRADDGTLRPEYGDYCFSNVPDTLSSIVGAPAERPLPDDVFSGVETEADRVVCVLLDGFGYAHWKRDYGKHPFLADLTASGTVTPLTSTYPSETAAAMTTFASGRQPVEHGVLGWWQYVPEIDRVIQTLPFTTLDDEPLEETHGIGRDALFPDLSTYERIAAAGRVLTVVQPAEIAAVTARRLDDERVETRPYRDAAEMALEIRRTLESGREFVYAYSPRIDGVAHESGTEGDAYQAQLASVTAALRRELCEQLDPAIAGETLLVVAADHGQVDTEAEKNVDLGGVEIWDHLRRDGDGEPIPPVGGPRNVRFHVRDGHVEALAAELSALDARLFTRQQALARDLFGDREPHPEFDDRCGELICVPRTESVWWTDDELELVGMHGGLDPNEMLVPFAAADLVDLQA